MSPESAPDLVRLLVESMQELDAAVAGLTDADAAMSPEAGQWSVLQCVEHVAVAEALFSAGLASAPRSESPVESRGVLANRVASRRRRVEAPRAIHPQGRAGLTEALQRFHEVRQATLHLVEARLADLPFLATEHPFFGRINGSDMIAVFIGHTRRHAAQVREIRAALGCPLPDAKFEERVP